MSPRGSTQMERWFQHAVQVLTVAGILGGVSLLTELKTKTAVLETKLIGIDKALMELKSSDHASRIRDLENKVARLMDSKPRK